MQGNDKTTQKCCSYQKKYMKKNLYILYWLFKTRAYWWSSPKYNILSFQETVNEIIKNKKSISRFGDGEFNLIIKDKGITFQKLDDKISERLYEVLNSELPNLLVAIPKSLVSIKNLKIDAKDFWLGFIFHKEQRISDAIKNKSKIFGDAFISRFYQDYINKKEVPQKVKSLQNIWENKNILIVEGEFSRLGIGNDFFSNAQSIERIICPAKNAFEKYDKILNITKEHGKNKLIIIALGPSATILAYDLAKENYWALDLGHIDIEYSWFLEKAKSKIPVRGKKSAEVFGQESFDLTAEEEQIYTQSICAKIG